MDCANVQCEPLLVTLESVDVRAVAEGVRISWTTAVEIDTAGFRVLRETDDRSKATLAVSPVIPSAGHGLTGATYDFLDNGKGAAFADRYYLEDIDNQGRVIRHGPFAVLRQREAPRGRTG